MTTVDGMVTNDEWWGVAPRITGVLASRGWRASDDAVRQVLPTVARHGNAVVAVPPSPCRAMPTLAGIVAAVAGSKGRALVVTAPALVEPLGRALAELAIAADLRLVTALSSARSARHLAAGSVDLLVTSPAVALALHTRSALAIDTITTITLAWPEDWDADEATTVLLADLPREAQRVILTGQPADVADLVERQVRRSLVVGYPATTEATATPTQGIRTLATSWDARIGAVTTVLELLDPSALSVWTADTSSHVGLATVLREAGNVDLVIRSTPHTPLVLCFDQPTAGELAELGAGRDVVVLVPPGTERYAARLAPGARPLGRGGLVDRLRDRDAVLREAVTHAVEHRDLRGAAYVLAPLFERLDPQAVAAACFALWRGETPASGTGSAPPPPPPEERRTPVGGVATARVWVGVGRRDEATTGDLVAVLIKEVGLAREAIGRIDLRETFALVEVPAGDADRVAQGLTGVTVRRRKLSARVDRGAPARPDRGRGPRR